MASLQANNTIMVEATITTARKVPLAPRAKRVGRACENCRSKRLKCTADLHPCMNCMLYHAECTYTSNPKSRTAGSNPKPTRARKSRSALTDSQIAAQDGPIEDTDMFQWDEINQESETFTQGEAMLQPETSRLVGQQNEAAASPVQERVQAQMEVNITGEVETTDIAVVDQTNMDDYNAMAEYLDDYQLETQTPLYLSVVHGSTSSRVQSMLQHAEDQIDSSLPEREVDGNVAGLDYFMGESRLPTVGGESKSILPGLVISKNAESSKFIGAGSTGATVATSLRLSVNENADIKTSDVLNYLIGAVGHIDEIGIPSSTTTLDYQLPDENVAAHGVNGYFRNIHILYPIVNAHNFQRDWPRLYDAIPPPHDPILHSRFFLIVAIGLLSGPRSPDLELATDKLAQDLYQKAWRMFSDVIVVPYAASVQVLILHVLYLIHLSKSGIAWVICGLAMRIAQSVGLHRKALPNQGLTEEVIRLRSQLWWVCYTLDAFLSTIQGRPPTTVNSACEVPVLPLVQYPDVPDDADVKPVANIYYWHVKLAQINNAFCNLFSGSETATYQINKVSELDTTIARWRDEIPMEYRPGQEILADREIYQCVAMLHLHYFNMIRVMFGTIIISARQSGIKLISHANPRIRASEAICVGSARSFVKVLNDMSNELEHEQLIPICFHTDHFMAAISVLFENIFKYPQRLSARTDLETLRAGQYHFELHVHPLRFNPGLRQLFRKMQNSAESLLNNTESPNRSMDSVRSEERQHGTGIEGTQFGDKDSPRLSLFESMFPTQYLGFNASQLSIPRNEVPL